MFTQLINKAASAAATGGERVRLLNGMMTRAADRIDTINRGAAALVGAARKLEQLSVNDLDKAGALLDRARGLAADRLASMIESGPAGRALRSIGSSLNLAESLSGKVSDTAAGLSSSLGEKGAGIGSIGGGIDSSLAAAKSSLGKLNLPGATADSLLLKKRIESSPLTDPSANVLSSLPDSSSSKAHLLVLTSGVGESYYFGLSTAAFESLRRQTSYTIASQDRLSRRSALQGVAKGGETISVSGAIFTRRAGAKQMNRLREIGFALKPLLLTTGYGESLGQWYMTKIDEEQAGLFADGMPRKQTFTLEFQRYGEDYSDI